MLAAFTTNAQDLVPDQNPNYMRSAEKYAQKSEELTATQSTTIQDTYEAYDWREAKAAEKQLRQDRRYELRKLRIQNRSLCYPGRYYSPYYYNQFSPYNYNTPYGYNNGYYGGNYGFNGGSFLLGTGLGLGLGYIFF